MPLCSALRMQIYFIPRSVTVLSCWSKSWLISVSYTHLQKETITGDGLLLVQILGQLIQLCAVVGQDLHSLGVLGLDQLHHLLVDLALGLGRAGQRLSLIHLLNEGVSTLVVQTEKGSTTLNLSLLVEGQKGTDRVVLRRLGENTLL